MKKKILVLSIIFFIKEKKLEFTSILGRIRTCFFPIRIHIKMMRIHYTERDLLLLCRLTNLREDLGTLG